MRGDTVMFYVDFNILLKEYGWVAALVLVIIIFLVVLILLLRNKKKDKTPNYELEEKIINALGGDDNVLEVKATMSRVSVRLKDYSKVNEEELKNSSVSRLIKMSDKLTLLVGSEIAINLENYMNNKK